MISELFDNFRLMDQMCMSGERSGIKIEAIYIRWSD